LNKYRLGTQEIKGSRFSELLSGGTKAMKISYVTTTFLTVTAFSNVLSSEHSDPQLKTSVTGISASMPLAFTENQGQWPDSILFRANAGGATMWFTKNGAHYQFSRRIPGHSREGGKPGRDVETAGVSTYKALV
jgi:hypothetical protein